MKLLIVFCLVILSTGCVNLLPPPAPRPQSVPLELSYQKLPSLKAVSWSLAVEKPLTSLPLDSKRLIVHVTSPTHVSALQPLDGIEWSDRLPSLVQQHVISAFEHTDKIMAVGQIDEDFQSDYNLQLDIKKAEIDVTSGNAKAHFEISAKLIRREDRQIIARQTFHQKSDVASHSQKDFIQAYTYGMAGLLHQIVTWTLKKGVPLQDFTKP